MLKKINIETENRVKHIHIFQADIMSNMNGVLCYPYYVQQKKKGDIYERVTTLLEDVMMQPIIAMPPFETLYVEKDGTLFLQLNYDGEEQSLNLQTYQKLLQIMLASLGVLQARGQQIQSVSLPMLFHLMIRNDEYDKYIQLLLYELSTFLKNNLETYNINIYLWHDADVAKWQRVFSSSIRLLRDRSTRKVDLQLKNDLIQVLKQPLYKKLLQQTKNPFVQQLQKPSLSKDTYELGIRLLNDTLNYLCHREALPKQWKLLPLTRKVIEIRNQRLFVEWFTNYINAIAQIKYEPFILTKDAQNLYFLRLTQVLLHLQLMDGEQEI